MLKQPILILSAFIFFISSCQKEGGIITEAPLESISDVEELAFAQYLATDIEESADEASIAPPPVGHETLKECAEITAAEERGIFPNTITIDFGDGCEGKNGKVRTGKIILNVSDSLHLTGSTREVTFDNYSIDGVQISGSKNWENLGIDESGLITIEKSANLTMDYPDGTSSTWMTDRTVTKSTHFVKYRKAGKWRKRIIRFKGTVMVTGETSGTNRQGVSYSATIIEALMKDAQCPWFGAGVVEMTKGDNTRSLNYGDGHCDRLATATLSDGSTQEIKIRPFWSR